MKVRPAMNLLFARGPVFTSPVLDYRSVSPCLVMHTMLKPIRKLTRKCGYSYS